MVKLSMTKDNIHWVIIYKYKQFAIIIFHINAVLTSVEYYLDMYGSEKYKM